VPRWDACGYGDDVEVLPASFAAMNEAAQFSRPCPVCGSENARPFVTKDGLRLVRCGDCAMIYVTPVPAAMASGEYYDQAGAEYYLSKAKLESDYAAVRFVRELKLFRAYCPEGSVLDVGCSSGAFLYQLRERYPGQYSVLGTDVSGAPLDYAESRGLPVVRGNFLQHDLAGRDLTRSRFGRCWSTWPIPRIFLNERGNF
jgi:SAM-dependent methyltransferase